MTPEQIETDARKCLDLGVRMTLVLPSPWKDRPHGFPRGELLCENVYGSKAYIFKPEKVLSWLENVGLIGTKDQS